MIGAGGHAQIELASAVGVDDGEQHRSIPYLICRKVNKLWARFKDAPTIFIWVS
jgi:hypothetical protein